MQIRKSSKNKGFTLVETLVYAFGLVLLLGTMTGFTYYMYNWYQFATASSKIDQVGLTVLDRIVRDIRSGVNYDSGVGQSSFGVNDGSITVNTNDNGVTAIKKYSLSSNNKVQYQQDGGTTQDVSPDNVVISKLLFRNISTSLPSYAVRVEIEITFNARSGTITREFDDLAILRQSYP